MPDVPRIPPESPLHDPLLPPSEGEPRTHRVPALLSRVRDGDAESFHALFDLYVRLLGQRVGHALPSRVRRRVGISDVVAEARWAAFEGRGTFAGSSESEFRHWLLSIADHKAADAVRRHAGASNRAVGRETTRAGVSETSVANPGQPTPSEVAMASEAASLAQRARDSLPADYSEILVLTMERGLTLHDAADAMDRSYEATKKLYGRALVRFRAAFQELQGAADD